MDFGFEKLKETDVQKDVSEKNQRELGGLKVSPEGDLLYRELGEEPEIKTPKDFINFLSKEIEEKVGEKISKERKRELIFFINYPKKFEENFERVTEGKSEVEVLRSIDDAIRDLSLLYDMFVEVSKIVLDQRMDYKNISNEKMNAEIKRKLDHRIDYIEGYKTSISKIIDFLESKIGGYIVRGEKNGTIERNNDED